TPGTCQPAKVRSASSSTRVSAPSSAPGGLATDIKGGSGAACRDASKYASHAGESRSRRRSGGFDALEGSVGQWAQERALPASSAVRKLEPQPQAVTAFGLLTVKPAPMRVST